MTVGCLSAILIGCTALAVIVYNVYEKKFK